MKPVPRNRLVAGFLLVLAAGILLQWHRAGAYFDGLLLDHGFRLLRSYRVEPVAKDVVIVGMDERTYSRLPEPPALWHHHIGMFLEAMGRARPAVVGVAFTMPDRSYDSLLPGYDQALLAGVVAARSVAPLVLVRTIDEYGNFRPVHERYVEVTGEQSLATSFLCPDSDDVVRRVDQRLCQEFAPAESLSYRMAEQMGVQADASGIIDYTVGQPFSYIPFGRVLNWIRRGDDAALTRTFAGRPVLLGAVLASRDRYLAPVALADWEPLNRRLPGIVVHAQALRSMLAKGLVHAVPDWTLGLLTLVASLFWFGRGSAIKWLAAASFIVSLVGGALWLLWHGKHLPVADALLTAGIAYAARFVYQARERLREKNLLVRTFSNYVSPAVLREIFAGHIEPALTGTRTRVAVLVTDIRGFSARSGPMPAQDVIELLNDYFAAVIPAIQRHGGTVDKFSGDGLMAYFGAPQRLACPEKNALEAAQDVLIGLERLNARLADSGREPLRAGVGLHAGEVVVGHVGSESLHQYTAIGDVVSAAEAIERLTRELPHPVLLSGDIADAVGRSGGMIELGARSLDAKRSIVLFGWTPPALLARTAAAGGTAP